MNRIELSRAILTALVFIPAGCSTPSPSHYISPRITGRVIDAKSGQSVENVRVQKTGNDERTQSLDSAKGGQQMTKTSAAYTKADGSFVMVSEKEVAIFRAVGWYSVTISFEHPDYYKSIKSYTPKNATNTQSGEPWIEIGDISMDPIPK